LAQVAPRAHRAEVLDRAVHDPVELGQDLLRGGVGDGLVALEQPGEQPRVAQGAAGEHDRLGPRPAPRVDDPRGLVHASGEDHGRGQRGHELAGQVEVGLTLVMDLRAARMEGDAGDAGLGDEPVGELDARGVALLLARAQLDGDRQARALRGGARDGDGGVVVREHRGARAGLRDLGTGQPMLRSMRSTSVCSATCRAALRITSGSWPKSCRLTRPSSGCVRSISVHVFSLP
jgi:hypothetical protein